MCGICCGISLLVWYDVGAVWGRAEIESGKGEVVIDVSSGDEERLCCRKALREGLLEESCGHVASVICHWGDGEGKVALDEDRSSPPHRPCLVSSGIGSEFWGTDGVEFWSGWVGRVLEDESVGLGL